MKICIVLGTRPEILKMYSLIRECKNRGLDFYVIHTGQHYSDNMSKNFFIELGLPRENFNLGVNDSNRVRRGCRIQTLLHTIREKEEYRPDIVFVQGDTDSAFYGALTSNNMGIKVCHIEAGIRSDTNIPEEANRRMIDQISDYLMVPTQSDYIRMVQSGLVASCIKMGKHVQCIGNTICDAIKDFLPEESYQMDYIYMTLHRQENVDNKSIFSNIITQALSLNRKILFSCHPRTKKKAEEFGIDLEGFILLDPLPYKSTISNIKGAKYIITDSGGIQEECCILGKKCIVLRENTERPYQGSILRGGNLKKSMDSIAHIKIGKKNIFNPRNSENIASDILDFLLAICTK